MIIFAFFNHSKMKKLFSLLSIFTLIGCAEMQQVLSQLPQNLSQVDISNGLKEALTVGVSKQVSKLTQSDGFFRNDLVKIMLPEELKKVDQGLRKIGLGSLADEGLKAINRTAEGAVKDATPIFVDAIKNMSFNDAKNILMGSDNSATSYLQSTTSQSLYSKFSPVIKNNFNKVGADKIWGDIISKYNTIPFVKKVNPDLTDYVTQQTMNGVFKMIAVEEKEIRVNAGARSTDLLKRVFAMQDN